MWLTIQNSKLKVTVDTLGAQLMSICSADGYEYLWQGDSKYWNDRAPVLFPFIGRLQDEKYRLNGRTYSMQIHGFANSKEFSMTSHKKDLLVLTLLGTIDTAVSFPYEFVLEITYKLEDNALVVQNRVKNNSGRQMHFALGGHPGFCVPISEGESFEDYYLEFSEPCKPNRVGFTSDTILLNGKTEPFGLEKNKILPLKHSLFDEDAIVLQDVARQISLKNKKANCGITVSYEQMPYLGLWHWPKTDAPYICIEPWSSLPGRAGIIEDIACRADFIHLDSNKVYENVWSIKVF